MGPLCEGDVLPLSSPLDSRLRGNDVWCARNDVEGTRELQELLGGFIVVFAG